MVSAKDIVVKPIAAAAANKVVKAVHYSGKVVQNSQLHLGAYLDGKLEGAMQFGPSLDKRKLQGLVEGTGWNGFIELNRMAFSDRLPRNSESRAISVAMRLIRKHYPHIEWVISFADGAQCGDGTIYRASGFVLTGLKKNSQIWESPNGERYSRTSLTDGRSKQVQAQARATAGGGDFGGGASMKPYVDAGWKPLSGFQLRYMYFINPDARKRLTVPILPFSKIDEMGASMYKGIPRRVTKANSGDQLESGGAIPTHTLQSQEVDA